MAQLPCTPHSSVKVSVLECRFYSISSFWEKVWGKPDYHVNISCASATGPTEFTTKMFRKEKNSKIFETFLFVLPNVVNMDGDNGENFAIEFSLFKCGFKCSKRKITISKSGDTCLRFDEEQAKVNADIELIPRESPDLRFSSDIGETESSTLNKRRSFILPRMQSILQDEIKPRNEKEVPTISILCSGGGLRATIQFCGAMEALYEEGILDCASYISAVSGGAWYILTAYAKQAFGSFDELKDLHTSIKSTTKSSILSTFVNLSNYLEYSKYRKQKELDGQPMNFTDFYGFTIGKSFLPVENKSTTLSDLRNYVESGNVPIPLVKAVHAKSTISTSDYHADLELNVWEMSMPNYKLNIKTEDFGSEWYAGKVVRSCSEEPLHFYFGATSSAFGLLLKYYLDGETVEMDSKFIEGIRKYEFGNRKTKRSKRGNVKRRFRRRTATLSSSTSVSESEYNAACDSTGGNWRMRSKRKESTSSRRKSSGEEWFDAKTDPSEGDSAKNNETVFVKNLSKKSSANPLKGKRRTSVAETLGMSLKDLENKKKNKEDAFLQKIMENMRHHPLFNDREAVLDRTAKVLNFSRGLSFCSYIHLNRDLPVTDEDCLNHLQLPTDEDIISFVDSAVVSNVPTNSVLRSDRKSDILIVCDATDYKSDTHIDYLQIFIAERLAKQQGLKFPKVDPQILKDNPRGVVHIFAEEDPECPTVIWFTLSNRDYKRIEGVTQPEARRGEKQYKLPKGEVFNDFPVFGATYTTFRSGYTPLEFDRLRELMKFNVKSNVQDIKCEIGKKILQRRCSQSKD